ncbi:MAG: cyclic nucleotide-binding domain-containing protein [Chloroflexi bacterium]|nr:cyclic nucleotide-binding domain-containing protein [Chloroflexota bacterium]MBL7062332.1 cyclic nucleotide-binding domain-containing protein [Dehalococcoidia bacterium]
MVTVEVLKGFEFFNGLTDDSLAKLTELCHVHAMHEGDRIFAEGSKARDIHFCHSGKVDILIWVREPWNKNIAVHRAEPGELFGWSALVVPYTYTASAECVESGDEIRIKGHELLAVFGQNPLIGYTVMENLGANVSARLTQTRQKLVAEWLGAPWPTTSSSSAWGEPGRR